MIPHDYHVHSHHSVDSKASIEEMCLGALAAGITEIGITEHFDLHPNDPACDWFKPAGWAQELAACRERLGDRIDIRAGLEAGETHCYAEELKDLKESCQFDYVIGSLHWVGDDFLFDPAYFGRPADEAFGRYFEELERMAAAGGIEILGHLDVPARLSQRYYGKYDPRIYEDRIRPVLRRCIEQGIALDVNTSAIRKGVDVLTPGLEILTWYREMGGERVTLGSDAHRPQDVGADLHRALDAIRRAGLRSITRFEGLQAKLVSLPASGNETPG